MVNPVMPFFFLSSFYRMKKKKKKRNTGIDAISIKYVINANTLFNRIDEIAVLYPTQNVCALTKKFEMNLWQKIVSNFIKLGN